MAYMSQENKKQIVEAAKPILKKYGVKATFAVNNHSTIVCNIKSGKLDLVGNYNAWTQSAEYRHFNPQHNSEPATYIDVNPYHYQSHFTGKALEFMTELFAAINSGNWDKSDIQTDYFNVGWYVDVNVGSWSKPYVLE